MKSPRILSTRISFGRILILLSIPALIAGICVLDALFIEPNFPRVITQEIVIKDLPNPLDGLKIVHLTDLHIVTVGKREDRALAKINLIKPDVICMTGDYVEDDGITPGYPTKADCTRSFRYFSYRLRAKHGVYAVSGNWDPPTLETDIAGTGVTMLDDKAVTLRIGGADLTISGSRPVEQGQVKAHPLIVLDHFPEVVDNLVRTGRQVDLMLAGHWHGGQVNIPGQTPQVKYLAGYYKVGDAQLYVGRGLGHAHTCRSLPLSVRDHPDRPQARLELLAPRRRIC